MKMIKNSFFTLLFVLSGPAFANVAQIKNEETQLIQEKVGQTLDRILKGQRYDYSVNIVFDDKKWDQDFAEASEALNVPGIPRKGPQMLLTRENYLEYVKRANIVLTLDQGMRNKFVGFVKNSVSQSLPAAYKNKQNIRVKRIDFKLLSQDIGNGNAPAALPPPAPEEPQALEAKVENKLEFPDRLNVNIVGHDGIHNKDFRLSVTQEPSVLDKMLLALIGLVSLVGLFFLLRMSSSMKALSKILGDKDNKGEQSDLANLLKNLTRKGLGDKERKDPSASSGAKLQGDGAVALSNFQVTNLCKEIDFFLKNEMIRVPVAVVELYFRCGTRGVNRLLSELPFQYSHWIKKHVHHSWADLASQNSKDASTADTAAAMKEIFAMNLPMVEALDKKTEAEKLFIVPPEKFVQESASGNWAPLALLLPHGLGFFLKRFDSQIPLKTVASYFSSLSSFDLASFLSGIEQFQGSFGSTEVRQEISRQLRQTLDTMDYEARAQLIKKLSSVEPRLTQEIEKSTHQFKDLLLLPKNAVGELFSQLSSDELVAALVDESSKVAEHCLSAYSESKQALALDEISVAKEKKLNADWSLKSEILEHFKDDLEKLKSTQKLKKAS